MRSTILAVAVVAMAAPAAAQVPHRLGSALARRHHPLLPYTINLSHDHPGHFGPGYPLSNRRNHE